MRREDDDNTALFERYLDNEMSENEKNAFDKRLSDEPMLKEKFLLQQEVINDLKDYTILKEEMIEIYSRVKENASNKSKSGKNRKIWFVAAASIAFLIVIFVVVNNLGESKNAKELYASYYQPFSQDETFRDEVGNVNDSLYQVALKFYDAGNYDESASLLKQLLNDSKELNIAFLYLGNCYLNMNKPEDAKIALEQAIESEDNQVRQYGKWYMALWTLKNEEKDKTSLLLEEIIRGGGVYELDASLLLEELR